jgi:hypothetical protein
MAARIIESAGTEPAPPRMVLGSQALESTLRVLRERIEDFEDFEDPADLARSTGHPAGG